MVSWKFDLVWFVCGLATSPAIHSGSGSGDDNVSVFTQLSTGDVFRQSADTALSVRSGKAAWFER